MSSGPCAGHGATALGKPTDSARANSTSALSTALQRASASTPTIWPLAGSICGWKRSSIRSRRMAVSRARSRRAKRAPGSFDPTPAAPRILANATLAWNGLTPGKALLPTRHSGAHRFGTVAPSREMPMLWPVNATRSSSASPERDLAAHGIGLVASTGQAAQAAEALLRRRYSWAEADAAQTLVALGGDGFMLQTLHAMLEEGEARPVFGMNRGTFGFLMNDWRLDRLYERIQDAKHIRVTPLAMAATDIHGQAWAHPAINEVSLLRETRQTAKIEICVNGGGDARTGRRRRAGRDAGGLDRL